MNYEDVTGDKDFLYRYGAEMLVETARLWYDLGYFSERHDGRFCIHRVTGPYWVSLSVSTSSGVPNPAIAARNTSITPAVDWLACSP